MQAAVANYVEKSFLPNTLKESSDRVINCTLKETPEAKLKCKGAKSVVIYLD